MIPVALIEHVSTMEKQKYVWLHCTRVVRKKKKLRHTIASFSTQHDRSRHSSRIKKVSYSGKPEHATNETFIHASTCRANFNPFHLDDSNWVESLTFLSFQIFPVRITMSQQWRQSVWFQNSHPEVYFPEKQRILLFSSTQNGSKEEGSFRLQKRVQVGKSRWSHASLREQIARRSLIIP